MAFVKIENGRVIEKQLDAREGFIEAGDDVVCGMLYDGREFTLPPVPAETYDVLRAREYPPIGDQLDAIMKWIATENEFAVPAELKSIAMKCMSVKAKYPKPEGEE